MLNDTFISSRDPPSHNTHVTSDTGWTQASSVQHELTTAVPLDVSRVVYRQPAVTTSTTTPPRSSGIPSATEILRQRSTMTPSGVVSPTTHETEVTINSLPTPVSPKESHQTLANHKQAQRPFELSTNMDMQNVPTTSTSALAALAGAQAHLSQNNIAY